MQACGLKRRRMLTHGVSTHLMLGLGKDQSDLGAGAAANSATVVATNTCDASVGTKKVTRV